MGDGTLSPSTISGDKTPEDVVGQMEIANSIDPINIESDLSIILHLSKSAVKDTTASIGG